MASSYLPSCHFRPYPGLNITILNDLVTRHKRTFDEEDLPEAEQPDVKRQRCSLPQYSDSACHGIPSSPSNGVAGSQVFLRSLSGTSDDSDLDATLLDFSDGESLGSPLNYTTEDEDRLLADDETDSSNVLLEITIGETDSCFAGASFQDTPLQGIPRDLDVSPEPLPPTGFSVHPGNSLPHNSSPANPGRGSHVNAGSPNQAGLPLSSDRFRAAVPIGARDFQLNKGNSESGILDREANRAGGEGSPAASHLRAEHEFASVVTDRPSEGQASLSEIQGEADFASQLATKQSISAQNEDPVEDPRPEDSSTEEYEYLSPDEPRRHLIFIPEELLQESRERYVLGVRAHFPHVRHPIVAVNELTELMQAVVSEYHSQELSYKHPTDLTTRNYAQRANIEIQPCTLEQWVNRNERHHRRFANFPDTFERSPIPSL